ncbi:expressed protein [Arabidopsis lyrata subsp. lyrata]|uniref:Expressed protein n=1 Tax=Arabidopsis lyrata subsp. lyrata TaxID=81972 RepID=D7L9V0_ARALL|nr:expressed protein [Arabidopsis lyrata subsp. lyrata]
MAPNNNLRSVIAQSLYDLLNKMQTFQCRHLSTRSRRNVPSSRSYNGNNNAIIELLEFRRTMMRDVEERNRRLGVRGEPPEILRDMLNWILQ